MVKSPLRYPGGKTKALKHILPLIPECQEFREPFVGGASVSLAIVDRQPQPQIWINDLNEDLIAFWQQMQSCLDDLIDDIQWTKDGITNGKKLYETLVSLSTQHQGYAALRFFVLNRITFSGLIDCGGYSQQAFLKRFTQSSIDRLKTINLDGFKITHGDYEPVMIAPGNDVFLFLDPPYFKAEKSKLYGKKGDLHTGFDHARFAEVCRRCPHRFLITYDDSPEIRELFGWATVKEWNHQYGMNNCGKDGVCKKGAELFVTNF